MIEMLDEITRKYTNNKDVYKQKLDVGLRYTDYIIVLRNDRTCYIEEDRVSNI